MTILVKPVDGGSDIDYVNTGVLLQKYRHHDVDPPLVQHLSSFRVTAILAHIWTYSAIPINYSDWPTNGVLQLIEVVKEWI